MPVRVAVCSLFKNSAGTLDYYRSLLENQTGDVEVIFSFVEGDSSDDTWERLSAWAAEDSRVHLEKHDVEPVADFDERVKKWAELGNVAIDQVADQEWDYLLWCESDLTLPPDLLEQLVADDRDVVAPAIFLGGMFYDTWGFRALDGTRFTNAAPYHPRYHPHGLVELASVGSVVLFRRAVIDAGVRFRGEHENGLLVGFCNDARAAGFRVFMDSRVAVVHPTSLWRAQQYALGNVRVEGVEENGFEAEIWRGAIHAVAQMSDLLLGTPDLETNHPALNGVRAILERRVSGRPFTLHTELHSEHPKRFTLVIRDVTEEAAPCPSEATR